MIYTIRNTETGDMFEFDTEEEVPSCAIFAAYDESLPEREGMGWGEVARIEFAADCLVAGALDGARDELEVLGMELVRTPEQIVREGVRNLLDDPLVAESVLTYLVREALYLSVKAEWSMEDNFDVTEWLARELSPQHDSLTAQEVAAIADECDLEYGEIDLNTYPQAESLTDDENEED